jgi:hypothetical protein
MMDWRIIDMNYYFSLSDIPPIGKNFLTNEIKF